MIRQTTIRQYSSDAIDLDKIRAVAGNPELRENEVFDFPTFIIARSGRNRNRTEITSDGQKAAVALWVGKSILYRSHKMETENQIGRIYDAWTVDEHGETVTYGKAYAVPTDSNKDILTAIKNGIHKEMSCAYDVTTSECSVCRADTSRSDCPEHGSDPQYFARDVAFVPNHVSFTADPAVEGAGLVTHSRGEEIDPALQRLADDGRVFRDWTTKEFSRWYRSNHPGADQADIDALTGTLTARQMVSLARIQQAEFQKTIPDGRQQLQAPEETKPEPVAPAYSNVKDIFVNRR